jgi:2-hydroxycyclohexanecarboxyl-CoA dehydrogenase
MDFTRDSKRLSGKVALITGSAGGIGAAAAELFCAEGASVVLVDRDSAGVKRRAEEIRGRVARARIEAVAADVTKPEEAEAAIRRAIAAFGSLNVLVSNAAVRYLSPVAEADPARWDELFSVNVRGCVNFCKPALPYLRRQPGSSIVVVSSTYALVGRRDFGAYDATKAALVSMTKTLAWEEAEHGIRVNAVCPGGTLTPYTVGRAQARGIDEAALRQQAKGDTLFKRWAEEREIAYPILWLASDEASFVTGAVLPVDGGTSIM